MEVLAQYSVFPMPQGELYESLSRVPGEVGVLYIQGIFYNFSMGEGNARAFGRDDRKDPPVEPFRGLIFFLALDLE